jgi:surfactin synthase thioesterase subunit
MGSLFLKPGDKEEPRLAAGNKSNVCKPEMYSRLMKHNAIEHVALEGGHMFPLEHPEKVASFIEQTLEQWNSAE